jgi:hypothetical protein
MTLVNRKFQTVFQASLDIMKHKSVIGTSLNKLNKEAQGALIYDTLLKFRKSITG